MLRDAVRALSDQELQIGRFLAWEEVRAAEGSGQREVWSAVLATLVLEAARRNGAPVDEVAAGVERVLQADLAELNELDWRRTHNALGDYASGQAGVLVIQSPGKDVLVRFPRLQAFWRAVQQLVEVGGGL